jgi:hypothetical protein
LPLLFDAIPAPWRHLPIVNAIVKAAAKLQLFAVVADETAAEQPGVIAPGTVIPLIERSEIGGNASFTNVPMIIIPDSDTAIDDAATLKRESSRRIVVVKVTSGPGSLERIRSLAASEVEVVNLAFDRHGREFGVTNPRHMRDVLREVHTALVKDNNRDEVTLITSGGIALPEHMAKAIICGADCVAIDIPLLLAMDCRLCGECGREGVCPVDLSAIETEYAVQRIINLMGSWHSQLLEMLGAMGIREARRLRGEKGRSMFFEDLERDAFGRLFGKRKTEFKA